MSTTEPRGAPDAGAVALTDAIAKLANDLFATDATAPGGGSLAPPSVAEPALGAGLASPVALAPQAMPGFSVPLLDAHGPEGTPGLDAAPVEATSVPYFIEAASGPREQSPGPAPALATPVTIEGDPPYPPARPVTIGGGLPFEVRPELVPAVAVPPSLVDPYAVRRDFPILEERVNKKRLVWLDNAATTQKPRVVIERLGHYYEHENSNVHRGAHTLAARSTDAYEGAREKVRRFLNASSSKEIVFVRGATEGINLVAQSWGRRNVREGDEVVITHLEHHANIVPWQMLCSEKGAKLRVVPVDSTGQVVLEEYERLLGPETRVVSLAHVSNALGTIVPAQEMIAMAHRHGARVLLDGAQSAPYMPVDVQLLDCDFFVFSGHKVFAPTGVGVLYGKRDVLAEMPPWQGGGNMITDVTLERTSYQPPPARFEAGTGNIADAVGLGAALDYVEQIGRANIERYEHELRVYAEGCLSSLPGLRIIGTAREKAGVISFVLDGVPTEEVGGMLDRDGIAVRSGHHCAQPILRRFGLEATVRASLAPYNTRADVDALVASVRRILLGSRA
jgi:cysteine desulfurase/selenocysteine lyase